MDSVAGQRSFTVYNGCPFTVWPAMFTSAGPQPNQPTGWEAGAYTSVTFAVADGWNGRLWGRRDCDFSNPDPATQCADGGCKGGLECDPNVGSGKPPATLAEFKLNGSSNLDNYDVSLVDGYNLPMSITNNKGCPLADCPIDLGPNCPIELKGPFDKSGFPVGCRSACEAGLSGDRSNSPDCCSGSHNTPETCPASGVKHYSYFKGNCPNAYAYAYDDATSLFTCPGGSNPNYVITFCP